MAGRRAAAVGRAAALAFAAAAAPGAADGADCGGADAIGSALVAEIPDGARIALIPFGPPHGAVPADAARDLYGRVQCAMSAASGGRHAFVARDLIDEKQFAWQEFDLKGFMALQKVDVMVVCGHGPAPGGVELSCVASAARDGSPLTGDVRAPAVAFPIADRYFPYEYAVSRLAHALAKEAPEGAALSGAFVAGRPNGPASELSSDIAERANGVAGGVLRARGGGAALAELTGGGESRAVELRGELVRFDADTLRLRLRLRGAGWEVVARGSATLRRAWLPPGLAADGGRHWAEARAVEGPGFGRAAARRAAANLARARLVAAALGLAAPGEEARSEAGALEALQILERGVPFDARAEWREPESGVHAAALEAEAAAVGAAGRVRFAARLKRNDLRPGDLLQVELEAEEPVRAGVFAWGADDMVWRLFPSLAAGETAALRAGGRAVAPNPEECGIKVYLPEGAREDPAIVVAVAFPPAAAAELEALAPPLCVERGAPMPEAVPAAGFLDALAGLPLERAAVVVRPYAVRAAE